jgi:CelD/BcsL family acetyltransferase involved in cellulose biosynthesis
VLDAMLDRLADDPRLPKMVALGAMGMDGPTMPALGRVLAGRRSTACMLEQFRRPKLASDLDGKAYMEKALSSSSRKKLRQHRRRLSEKGTLTSVIASEPEAVRRALEDFLALEASGWKGRQGTALLCDDRDAAFMRTAVGELAEQGCASIHALSLDGRAVSMQIVARAGSAAFTWKTAYDEKFHDVSPGMLLLEDYTAFFLADPTIAYVDSCAYDDSGFMSAWTERQSIADLWIDARRGGSLAFQGLSGLQRLYRDARAAAKNATSRLRRLRTR